MYKVRKHFLLAYFGEKEKRQNFHFLTKNHELLNPGTLKKCKTLDFFKSMFL